MTNLLQLAAICYALCAVESGHRVDARNGECIGILQLKPCYVAEANRLLGRNEFTLVDRWDEQRSIMMWWVVNLERRPSSPVEAASRHKTGRKIPVTAEDWDYVERVNNLVEEATR